MKLYRKTTILSCWLSIITLFISILLEVFDRECFDYLNNIFLGLFSGAAFSTLTSIIGYFVEKQKLFIEYRKTMVDILEQFLNFSDPTLSKIQYAGVNYDSLISAQNIYANKLKWLYNDYSPFLKNSKQKNFLLSSCDYFDFLYKEISSPLQKIRISLRTFSDSKTMLYEALAEICKVVIKTETEVINNTIVCSSRCIVVEDIKKYIDGLTKISTMKFYNIKNRHIFNTYKMDKDTLIKNKKA